MPLFRLFFFSHGWQHSIVVEQPMQRQPSSPTPVEPHCQIARRGQCFPRGIFTPPPSLQRPRHVPIGVATKRSQQKGGTDTPPHGGGMEQCTVLAVPTTRRGRPNAHKAGHGSAHRRLIIRQPGRTIELPRESGGGQPGATSSQGSQDRDGTSLERDGTRCTGGTPQKNKGGGGMSVVSTTSKTARPTNCRH